MGWGAFFRATIGDLVFVASCSRSGGIRRCAAAALAQAGSSAGYSDKALDDLDYVLKANPDRVDALIYRASANRAVDHLDPALADIEKALAHAPSSAPALVERGNIRRLKGDVVGARQDWERVGQLPPAPS